MTTKTLRIPMIIDANGKWCANGYTKQEVDGYVIDWPMIDEMADWENPLVCPQRMWITVEVTLPELKEVVGKVEAA